MSDDSFGRKTPVRKKRAVRQKSVDIEKSPYDILEVPNTADFPTIRKAYLVMVHRFSPEKEPEEFKRIQKAYAQLRDAASRKALDLTLPKTLLSAERLQSKWPEYGQHDYVRLFKERILRLLITSSDFTLRDFRSFFIDREREASDVK